MNWSLKDWAKFVFIVVALMVTFLTVVATNAEDALCEAEGGKRLRGTWSWEPPSVTTSGR